MSPNPPAWVSSFGETEVSTILRSRPADCSAIARRSGQGRPVGPSRSDRPLTAPRTMASSEQVGRTSLQTARRLLMTRGRTRQSPKISRRYPHIPLKSLFFYGYLAMIQINPRPIRNQSWGVARTGFPWRPIAVRCQLFTSLLESAPDAVDGLYPPASMSQNLVVIEERLESAFGYKPTSNRPKSTSALPPKADILVAVTDFRL